MSTPRGGWAGVNLIPAGRLRARLSAARAAMWVWVILGCCGLLVAAYVAHRVSVDVDTTAVSAALDEVHANIKRDELRIAKQGIELREKSAARQANKAVGEQPDWSILLALLTDNLGSEAAITSVALDPVETKMKEVGAGGGRPERLKLTIKGVSRTLEAASRFVLALEQSPAFDRVSLVETQRQDGADAEQEVTVAFQVVCDLSDPATAREVASEAAGGSGDRGDGSGGGGRGK